MLADAIADRISRDQRSGYKESGSYGYGDSFLKLCKLR